MNYKDKEQKNLRKSLKEFIFYTVFFMSLTVYNVVTEILQVISILTGSYALFSLEERFSYLDKIEKSFNEKNEVFYSRLEFIMSLLNVANGFLLLGVIPVKIVNLYV